jgi:Sec-independent protein translocase protein TatA
MPGLSKSELAIVVFLLLLVVMAGKLPRWGEALGSYLYKRKNGGPPGAQGVEPHDSTSSKSTRPPAESGSSSQAPLA